MLNPCSNQQFWKPLQNYQIRGRQQNRRHSLPVVLALFTMAVVAGNQGFLAIGDWLNCYRDELIEMFQVEKKRLPSYSTMRRVLLNLDYQKYSKCLTRFFAVSPNSGETVAVDGKMVRSFISVQANNPNSSPHPAIMLVNAYIVERGLILDSYEVDQKTNEIEALPQFIKQMAQKGVVFAFDAINTQKKLAS